MIYGGAAVALLGFIASGVLFMAGTFHATYNRQQGTPIGDAIFFPLALGLFGLGVLMVVGGLGYGIWINKNQHKGEMRMIEEVKVAARYAYDRDGSMLTSELDLEHADRPRFYIRLQHADGQAEEFECAPEVYAMAGEGMSGRAWVQGKWLSRFEWVRPEPSRADRSA
jgi:hypothetical protein